MTQRLRVVWVPGVHAHRALSDTHCRAERVCVRFATGRDHLRCVLVGDNGGDHRHGGDTCENVCNSIHVVLRFLWFVFRGQWFHTTGFAFFGVTYFTRHEFKRFQPAG